MARLPYSPYSKRGRRHSVVTRSSSSLGAGIVFWLQRISAGVLRLKGHSQRRLHGHSPRHPQRPSQSRLQQRLDHSLKRDQAFFELARQKRQEHIDGPVDEPSWLTGRLHQRRLIRRWRQVAVMSLLGIGVVGSIWASLFVSEQVTLSGVPYRVVSKFWQSKPARDAYFAGDNQALHDELVALNVEVDIKAYYRDRFTNEGELDLYIHQLMYNQTGYVGEAYEVGSHRRLKPKY